MDVTSLLLPEWILWLRGMLAAVVGCFLCRRRSYLAILVALLTAYWAYSLISIIVDLRTEVIAQFGSGYVIQAYVSLLIPFVFMALGLLLRRSEAGSKRHRAELQKEERTL